MANTLSLIDNINKLQKYEIPGFDVLVLDQEQKTRILSLKDQVNEFREGLIARNTSLCNEALMIAWADSCVFGTGMVKCFEKLDTPRELRDGYSCRHEWKATALVTSIVYDCKHCGMKKENF